LRNISSSFTGLEDKNYGIIMVVPPGTMLLWVMILCVYGADCCIGETCYSLLQGTKYVVSPVIYKFT
jgi:hypothetical protein